jgi:predicted permease
MPDFVALVREGIGPLGFGKERELKISQELAGQLAEVYDAIRAEDPDLTEDAAIEDLYRRIPPWDELVREFLEAEPPLTRFAGVRRWMGSDPGLLFDLRLSLRRLWSTPAFTVTTVLTLAVCLAANAAILTLVDRVLLHPLDVPNPEELVLVANQFPNTGVGGRGEKTAPGNYFDRVEGVPSLVEQALFAPTDRVIALGTTTEQIHGMEATPSLFGALAVGAAMGRTFTPEEGEIGNELRIVLSDAFWRDRFGSNPNVIGTTVRVNGRPHTVVGVMRAGFTFFEPEVRYWVPLVFPNNVRNAVANNWYHVGRMARGATIDQVQSEVDAVNAAFFDRQPNLAMLLEAAGFHSTVEPLEAFLIGDIGRVIYLLWGGAVAVLLIGALNIANLTLAEAHRRRRDLFTRMALGAGRGRLAAGLLFESLAMASAGGLLGLGLAWLTLRTLGSLRLEHFPSPDTIGMTWEVPILVFGIALSAGAFIAVAPLRRLVQAKLSAGLRAENRTGTSSGQTSRLRRTLVSAEVALAFVLIVGAGLFLITLRNLLEVDPGFEVERVVTAGVNLEGDRYPSALAARQFLDRALEAVRNVPGVTAAGATTSIPLRESLRAPLPIAISGGPGAQVAIAEDRANDGSALVTPTWVTITAGFFDALDTPVLLGRDFQDRDHQTDNPVAIVDETMAQAYWPGENPIGKRMYLLGVRNVGLNANTRWLTVVGVVPELLLEDLSGRQNRAGAFYTPWSEVNADRFPTTYGLVIQTTTDAGAVMTAVRFELSRLDPEMALFDIQTMTQRQVGSLGPQRMAMSLAAAFGGVALFLSALGVYGLLSYLVAHRTREFGIRIALGSSSGGIFRLVLTEGLQFIGIGLAVGLGAAYFLGDTMASQVYGVEPGDPLLLAGASTVLVTVAVAAALGPARRATRVDPLATLNAE